MVAVGRQLLHLLNIIHSCNMQSLLNPKTKIASATKLAGHSSLTKTFIYECRFRLLRRRLAPSPLRYSGV